MHAALLAPIRPPAGSPCPVLFDSPCLAIVARLAPVEIRGRYMGAWTLVWTAGQASLEPIFGGLLLTRLGPHVTYGAVILLGLVGAGLYPLLRSSADARRRRGSSTPR